jgi:hypothetical protein
MTFILSRDRPKNSVDEFRDSWRAYCDYLESVKDLLPKSAFEFATAEWHYNFSDPKATHDSWLEELIIREPAAGDRKQYRLIEIFIRLFAAYHDGYIELTYKNVRSYSFGKSADSLPNHRDWLYDEIRLSKNNLVLHEIEWDSGDWIIECEDVLYEWKPFEKFDESQ